MGRSMKKVSLWSELVETIARISRSDSRRAKKILFHTFEFIGVKALREKQRVVIPGFGVFTRRTRIARVIRNPITAEPMIIPAMQTLGFRPSKWQKRNA